MKQLMLSSILILLLSNSAVAVDFFTDIDAALLVSEKVQKNIVLIFSMDSCVYCDKLKQDLLLMNNVDSFIICIIDSEQHQNLVKQYSIRLWPSSIILSSSRKHNLLSIKTGYKNLQDYEAWLQQNKMVSYR
jgi:hypothetical protein